MLIAAVVLSLGGCAGSGVGVGVGVGDGQSLGAAPLRGFGVDVDQAVAARVPTMHLKTCGTWGCHEQDVALLISGPTSAAPCASPSGGANAAVCGPYHLPGPGPGYGYAPVPALTADPVTVTVTTPPGAPLVLNAEVRVRPHLTCADRSGPHRDGDARTDASPEKARTPCAGGVPQAQLRIAADGTVSQSR